MLNEYALPEELIKYDFSITRKNTYDIAEKAIAVERLIDGKIDLIHPRENNDVQCASEEAEDIFFPEFPNNLDNDDPESPWFGWIDAQKAGEDWFEEKYNEEYRKQMEAKAKCFECSAREQCLIWSLLSESKAEDEEMKKPVDDRYDDPYFGVSGGWGAEARKRIVRRKRVLEDKAVALGEEAEVEAKIIVEAAKNGIPYNVAKGLAFKAKQDIENRAVSV